MRHLVRRLDGTETVVDGDVLPLLKPGEKLVTLADQLTLRRCSNCGAIAVKEAT